MQKYETTLVIDSLQKADDMQTIVTKMESFISNHGGAIINKEEWGKKRLAYEINRKQYGNYYHLLFEGPGTIPALLEREYRLEESVLRYLTVKAEPRNYPEKPEVEESAAADPVPESVVAEPVVEKPAAVETSAETETETETAAPVEEEDVSESQAEPEAVTATIDPVVADNEADKTTD